MVLQEPLVVVTDSESDSMEIEKREAAKHGIRVVRFDCRTEDEVIDAARDADVILVDLAPITQRVISQLGRCRAIVRYGIGLNNIDVDAATRAGIFVVNLPTYCVDEVATHAVALLLACDRKIVQYNTDVKNHVWDFQLHMPVIGLPDSTVGVVAFGNIAQSFARKMQAFGPRLAVHDPYVSPDLIRQKGATPVSLEELLTTSDFISLHAPLTQSTRGMIGERELKMMKKNCFLINTSRGGLVDEGALYKALSEGWIAGAGLDTTDPEPPEWSNPLLKLDNVIITPHAAFYSETSLEELHSVAIQEAVRVIRGQRPGVVVNKDVVPRKVV